MSSEPATEDKPATEDAPEPVAKSEAEPVKAEPKAEPKADTKAETKAETKAKRKAKAEEPPPPGVGTPEGDRYAEALRAFEVGDYRLVRELCRALSEARQDDVARAARDLDARTRVDPFQVIMLCACLAFFSWIAYVYVIR